jgi:hypothetical protein
MSLSVNAAVDADGLLTAFGAAGVNAISTLAATVFSTPGITPMLVSAGDSFTDSDGKATADTSQPFDLARTNGLLATAGVGFGVPEGMQVADHTTREWTAEFRNYVATFVGQIQ